MEEALYIAISEDTKAEQDRLLTMLRESEDFALAGYRLSALGYLVKPYGKAELENLLKKAQDAKMRSSLS